MWRNAMRLSAVVAGLAIAPWSVADEYLYVHNTYSGEISKIAVPEHEVVGSIEIGYYMDYLAQSPDGRILYVNRIEGDLPGARARNVGVSGELIAVDTTTDQIAWRMKLDGMPHHMSVSKDGKTVFVPYYDTWWVAVVDVDKREVIKKIWVGHGSHGTKLSPDGKRLYVGSMMNDTMTIIDTEKLEVVDVIGFRDAVRPFAITKDEKRMYVQQSWLHGFIVVDLETKEKLRKVMLPRADEVEMPDFYPHNVNHGIALSPDEKYLFVNGSALNFVAVYSHPDLNLIKTIPVGTDPNSITFRPDGSYAYVSNRRSDDLSIIDVEKLEEVARIKLGRYPQRMAIINVPETGDSD